MAKIGWLYSLAAGPNSNWGHVHCFHQRLSPKEDQIVISSQVWGRKKQKDFDPQPGDGFAFYHSTSAEFPAGDRFKRKARISVIGELVHIESDGLNISYLKIKVAYEDLMALAGSPIVRDASTKELFERCGIVQGFAASLYMADRAAWAEIMASLEERRRKIAKAAGL